NGTRINGRRVEAGRLRPGDTLMIATLHYRLEKGQRAEARRADPQAVSRAESASLCDLPGTSLDDASRPEIGPILHRARALRTTGRAVWRAVRLLCRAASSLRTRSVKIIGSRAASLAVGGTYPIAPCKRTSS